MAKNNTVSWVKLVITIVSLIVVVAIAWATVSNNVENNVKDIETNTKNITILDGRTDEVEDDIIKIQGDITYIKEGIDEIKKKL